MHNDSSLTLPMPVASGGTGGNSVVSAQTAMGLQIGSDVQAYDVELAALASVTSAADKLPYFNGSGTASLADFTTFMRTLSAKTDAAGVLAALNLTNSDGLSEGSANLYFSNERAQDAIGAALAADFVYNDAANSIGLRLRSVATPTRSLNTAFQISADRDAVVAYSVDVSCTLSLVTGQTGTIYLRYADDSGHTTNVKEVCRSQNGNTGSLTIGLNLTQNATGTLSGIIPAGKYAKLVTENNVGSPTFTYRSAQEVLM